ncbi:hypothetical protein AEA09_02100 [Lysinibacillus contaminans]|uniref:Uncharacterized protein n=1 Tax=Lysinibacillus contaminans TaxID=1293441 RepID=A0ABR5K6B2_9BACI|nr:hypothetical protein [Lysinibacillus contaminans]KOS71829.1 hypothetical protein AEA09_02100 [Lysinibacillus contaminans]
MDDKQFDKRMELLKKSYDRMEPQLDPIDVFAQIEVEESLPPVQTVTTPPKHPSKWQKPAVWAASIASVLLVGLLVAPYVLETSTSLPPTEEIAITPIEDYDVWLDEFTKTYETKREQMREELDMPEEALKQLQSVQSAASALHHLKKDKERILSNQKSTSGFIEDMTAGILELLMTPREKIQKMADYDSKEQVSFSDSFSQYDSYAQNAEDVARYYTEQLAPFKKFLLGEPAQFPQELKNLIATANKQYIELQNDGQFRPDPIFGKNAPSYMKATPPDVLGYYKHLATGSLLVGGDLRLPASETADILVMYEQVLIADPFTDFPEYMVLKGEFENTWLALLKGTDAFPMRMADGRLTEEYQDFVMGVANGEYGEAMQGMVKKIVSELESGESQTLTQLTEYDVSMGILSQKNQNFEYFNATKVTTSGNWIQEAHLLYKAYTESGDVKMLDTLHPLNVAKLFLFALSQEDYKTAQQLITSDVELADISKFNDIRIFSELSVTYGSTVTIIAIVKEEEREIYGQEIIFKIDKVDAEGGQSRYRISAINK